MKMLVGLDAKLSNLVVIRLLLQTRSLRSYAAKLLVLVTMTITSYSFAGTQTPWVKIGVLRWDDWNEASKESSIFDRSEWQSRTPYFAVRRENGKLDLEGDLENVMSADISYARSAGIDYFVFGYFPDTGSLGRPLKTGLALNRALSSYLHLPDHGGVRFAVALNQPVLSEELDDLVETLTNLVSQKDYIVADNGYLPVFIYEMKPQEWISVLGSIEKEREFFSLLKIRVKAKTTKNLLFIVLNYAPKEAAQLSRDLDFSMFSTYTTFAPDTGGETPFSECLKHSVGHWKSSEQQGVYFLPNVTLGWDSRPREAPANKQGSRRDARTWCSAASSQETISLVQSALLVASSEPMAVPFRSILVYAWNEFTEGGWIAPTQDDSHLQAFRAAVGRKWDDVAEYMLSFPDQHNAEPNCRLRTTARTIGWIDAKCPNVQSTPAQPRKMWPCPPGTTAAPAIIEAPSGFEAKFWGGAWVRQKCLPNQQR